VKIIVKMDRWKDRMHAVCIIYIFPDRALSSESNSTVVTK